MRRRRYVTAVRSRRGKPYPSLVPPVPFDQVSFGLDPYKKFVEAAAYEAVRGPRLSASPFLFLSLSFFPPPSPSFSPALIAERSRISRAPRIPRLTRRPAAKGPPVSRRGDRSRASVSVFREKRIGANGREIVRDSRLGSCRPASTTLRLDGESLSRDRRYRVFRVLFWQLPDIFHQRRFIPRKKKKMSCTQSPSNKHNYIWLEDFSEFFFSLRNVRSSNENITRKLASSLEFNVYSAFLSSTVNDRDLLYMRNTGGGNASLPVLYIPASGNPNNRNARAGTGRDGRGRPPVEIDDSL
ncbi:hypothetical protein PUN28_006056 [Cardiocondyla obscurior]|uniref:Uncharacterized protein n=1 Tax=Cardiocondyla obscurior TaxID=286306 RepID=A0AAW2G7I0_9HYME